MTLTEGVKNDQEKLRWDLVPWDAVEPIVAVLNFGAVKYAADNWAKGICYRRVFAALIRHLTAWFTAPLLGQDGKDPESGLSHLSHAGCCLFFLLAYEQRQMKEFDDRPTRPQSPASTAP